MSYADDLKDLTLFKYLKAVSGELADFRGVPVHRSLLDPLAELTARAAARGFELALASGFRSIERQCHIWNAKANGQRSVLDDAGVPLDIADLEPEALMFAILRWSALPGTSRHHWGTDVDVYDRAALPAGESLQLTLAECRGPFAAFHQWLDGELAQSDALFPPLCGTAWRRRPGTVASQLCAFGGRVSTGDAQGIVARVGALPRHTTQRRSCPAFR